MWVKVRFLGGEIRLMSELALKCLQNDMRLFELATTARKKKFKPNPKRRRGTASKLLV